MSIYHLNHTDGHWILTGNGTPGPLARFITRPEAVLHSSQLAREVGGSLEIHGHDGDVEEVRTYRPPHPEESPGHFPSARFSPQTFSQPHLSPP